MILSKTAVSNVTEILSKEFEEFQNRDLSEFEIEYLFLDGIYETLRPRFGIKEAVLCAWGITRDGEKVLLYQLLIPKPCLRETEMPDESSSNMLVFAPYQDTLTGFQVLLRQHVF